MKKLQYYGPNRYRWKNELGAYRYFTIRTCRCGMRFLTDWYEHQDRSINNVVPTYVSLQL